MKKNNIYFAPAAEFVAVETEKDILAASNEFVDGRDEYSEDFGIIFPF